jgi:DNA polymerase III alpha subunit
VAGFAEFGFCKSHAAAFARTVYETAWLRLEHPAHWLCALLNAQPMGFYHPSVLVDDAKRHGVRTLPVDVTRSRARCTVERLDPADPTLTEAERAAEAAVHAACRDLHGPVRGLRPPSPLFRRPTVATSPPPLGAPSLHPWAVRLGFAYVARLGPVGRAACEAAADAGAVSSMTEFWRRTRLDRPAMEQLIRCGAFDRVHPDRTRRELLWELVEAEGTLPPRRRRPVPPSHAGSQAATVMPAPEPHDPSTSPAPSGPPSLAGSPSLPGRPSLAGPPRGRGQVAPPPADTDPPLGPLLDLLAPPPALPPMSTRDRAAAEYAVHGLTTGPHLVAFIRPALTALGCVPLAAVRDLPDRAQVRVAGLVIARQAPVSARGFRFFTLADEGAHLDLVFRPEVARRTRAVANSSSLLLAEGMLEVNAGRLNLLVSGVAPLDGEGRLQRTGPGTNATLWRVPEAHDYR